jgi:hypothetical protein
MRYRIEFHPNPDCVTIHVNKRLIRDRIQSFESPSDGVNVYEEGVFVRTDPPPAFVKYLFEIDGIEGITLRQFGVRLKKGSVFGWENVLSRAIAILNLELFPDDEPKEVGPPRKPSQDYLEHLRRQGCDV